MLTDTLYVYPIYLYINVHYIHYTHTNMFTKMIVYKLTGTYYMCFLYLCLFLYYINTYIYYIYVKYNPKTQRLFIIAFEFVAMKYSLKMIPSAYY